MKKILFLTLLLVFVLGIFNCPAPTMTITVKNNSSYPSVLNVKHVKENIDIITLHPAESKTFSMFNSVTIKMAISQQNVTRNYLNFTSPTLCQIENIEPTQYTIMNTTRFKVKITEKQNLFDSTEIDGISSTEVFVEKKIDVYSSNLNIQATTIDSYGITLKVEQQGNKIIIKL